MTTLTTFDPTANDHNLNGSSDSSTAAQASAPAPAPRKDFAELTPEIIEKQKAFYETRIKHPALKDLLDDLLPLLLPHSETSIIFITGATGVGKTTLCRQILQTLVSDFAPIAEADPSAIPLVAIEAYSNGDGRHGFKSIYEDLARELMEPGMDAKRNIVEVEGRLYARTSGHGLTIPNLRRIVEGALEKRKTRVVVIDEAAHLMRFTGDMAPMDTLKSLANTSGVKLIFVGSFDMMDMVLTHGQIARRTSILLLDRYHFDNKAHRKTFKNVLGKLMSRWPCDEVPDLEAVEKHLHEVSLGCVGLLKSVLLDASAYQLRNHGQWKPEFLVKAAKSNKLYSVIRSEIERGEAKVRDAVVGTSIWDEDMVTKLMKAVTK